MGEAIGHLGAMDKPRKPISRKDRSAIAAFLQTQRGRPQARPARSAGIAAGKVMRPLSKKFGSGASGLLAHWPQIVGSRWAKISKPQRFMGGREGRTLIITAPGAAASLIMANSGPIIDRLNSHLGEGSVARIKVVQGQMKDNTAPPPPLPHRGPQTRLATPADTKLQSGLEDAGQNDLKAALDRLGRGVMTRP